MYATGNPKTKKALREAVELSQEPVPRPGTVGAVLRMKDLRKRVPVEAFQPGGIFPSQTDGQAVIEGPHFPQPHRWYATVKLVNGVIVRVLS